jgi:VIT1/CCC1 family predicted Fe2+/Mn2+ transporter
MSRTKSGRWSDTPDREALRRFRQYHEDELQAALLYRGLAELDAEKRDVLLRLAEAEERHAAHWRTILADHDVDVSADAQPSLHTRWLLATARRMGVERVLPIIIRAEAADASKYRGVPQAPSAMAREEMAHGRRLAEISGTDAPGAQIASSEGRHRTRSGGALRAAVFGVNDGLVSNFSLVMGVAGGTADADLVVLAGVAGLFAGAFSMAAGEWISVRSQHELYEREIEAEREELEAFPDEEQAELELIYRAKGLDDEEAKRLAEHLFEDPDTALDTMVREELGLDPEEVGSSGAWVASSSSFVAFAIGAIIPLLPFLVLAGAGQRLVASAVVSALALATVGASLGVLTRRSVVWSAARMALIGSAAAAATYAIGTLFGVAVS